MGERGVGAHVAAHLLWNGPVQDGHEVMHRCDNRRCVFPLHLTTGTRQQNLEDARAKGRMAGWGSGKKLTDGDVAEIRAWFECGGWQQKDLAEAWGVSHTLVWAVLRNRERVGGLI